MLHVSRSIRRESVFRSNEWPYAWLVLALLLLAGLASKLVMDSFQSHPSLAGAEHLVGQITLSFIALTTGLLFLAGALGIWAIRTSMAVEGAQRVGRFVDEMESLQDGIVVAEPEKGELLGMNFAARALISPQAANPHSLRDYFPCLTREDVAALLDLSESREVERVSRCGHALYSLRFRSQPSADMTLILISDTTSARTRQMHERQLSHFQLIGRLSRAVAHDFNNLLCSISAHASLLDQQKSSAEDRAEAVATILSQSERGSTLARQLISLSEIDTTGRPAEDLPGHVRNASELLRVTLSPLWSIRVDAKGAFPPIPMDGNQVEQILMNLGLLATEEWLTPGELRMRLRPSEWGREGAREVMIEVVAGPPGIQSLSLDDARRVDIEDAGVIESVVRSVVEGVAGRLHILSDHDGHHAYRLVIPGLLASQQRRTAQTGLPRELLEQLRNHRVLLARPRDGATVDIEARLASLEVAVEFATDLVVVLGRMEAQFPFHAVIVDRRLLGDSAEALLSAMLKLKPQVAFVVLCAAPDMEPEDLKEQIAFESLQAAPDTILKALSRAARLAAARAGIAE
jgi:signal transduction histidine kinase